MIILSLLFYTLLYLCGLGLISLVIKKPNLLDWVGFSFGLGIILVFFISLTSFVISVPIFVSMTFFFLASIASVFRLRGKLHLSFEKKYSLSQLLLLVAIFLNVIFVFTQTLIRPLIAWDGIASWLFGAKALYLDGKITAAFYHYANYDFPPLFQSLIAFQANIIGKFDEKSVLLFFPLVYTSLVLSFFSTVAQKKGLSYGLIFTFILASTQEVLRQGGYLDHGHIDILLSYFVLCSGVMWLKFYEKKEFSYFLLLQVFLLGVAFTKNEGIIFYILFQILTILTSIKHMPLNYLRKLGVFAFFLTPFLGWMVYKTLYLPPNYRFEGELFLYINRFLPAARQVLQEFLNISRWNIVWILILFSSLFFIRQKTYVYLFLLLVVQVFVYFGIYIMSPYDPVGHIVGSFDRLLLHIFPLLLLLCALAVKKSEKLDKMLR